MIVYADLRWRDKTGIGVVNREILQRAPRNIEIVDLKVKGRIGSPFFIVSCGTTGSSVQIGLEAHCPACEGLKRGCLART